MKNISKIELFFNYCIHQEIFDDFDLNKDGKVTRDEYKEKLGIIPPQKKQYV